MNNNGFNLSYEELIVIAAFLNNNCILGIDSSLDGKPYTFTSKKMISIIKGMERKRLLKIGMEGVVFIRKELKKMVQVICAPEYIIEITPSSIQNNVMYVFKKESVIVFLKQKTPYLFTLTVNEKILSLFDIIQKKAWGESTLCELKQSSFETLKRYYNRFEEDKAKSLIELLSLTDSGEVIELLAQGSLPLSKMVVFQKNNALYKTIHSFCFFRFNQGIYEFDSYGERVCVNKLNPSFEKGINTLLS